MNTPNAISTLTYEDRLSPEVVDLLENAGVHKVNNIPARTALLSILAGAFIALGAYFSIIVATGADGVWYGGVQLMKGIVFSMGLGLVIAGGAELFTGSVLHVMALASRKVTLRAMMRNWVIVFTGNAVGAIGVAILIVLAGVHMNSGGELGTIALKIASTKAHLSTLEAFMRGVLCNIMVCIAIWVSLTSRTIGGKTAAFTLPIAMFVAAGFEHVVANLFFLPYAHLLTWVAPEFAVASGTTLTLADTLHNIFFVGLGNIVGGALLVGMVYWVLYKYLPRPGTSSRNA